MGNKAAEAQIGRTAGFEVVGPAADSAPVGAWHRVLHDALM